MKKLSHIISFILILVIAFSCTACKFNQQQINIDIPSEVSNEKVVNDSIADNNSQIFEVSLSSSTYNNYANYMSNAISYSYSISDEDVYAMAVGCIADDIVKTTGCETQFGYVYVNEETIISGYIFTDWSVAADEEQTIYNGGFVQLKELGSDDLEITEDMVKQGLIACVEGLEGTSFLINQFTLLESFSFVYSGKYVKYQQTSNYVVEIGVFENKRTNYDEAIHSLFDYDNTKYLWENLEYKSISANSYFSDEAKAYELARRTVSDIIALQDENGTQMEIATVIIYVEESINEYLMNSQISFVNGYSIDELEKIEASLESNQFLVVSPDGVSICSVPTVEELSQQRVANGWIQVITGALIVAGSAIVTIATCGAATPALITTVAVVSGSIAVAYGGCELIQGLQELDFGYNQDVTSESVNLGVELFKSFGLSEEDAQKTYHAVGLSATLINQLTMPVGRVVSMTSGFFKTTIAIGRVVLVETAKMAITGLAALVVNDVATDVAVELGAPAYARLVGYGSALFAGMLVYRGANRIDQKLNISGLFPKLSMNKIISDKTLAEASKNFSDEQWTKMTTQQKKDAIYELAQQISKEFGWDTVPEIKYYRTTKNECGFYWDGDDTVYLNQKYLNENPLSSDGLVDTLAHELTHRNQYLNLMRYPDDPVSYSYRHYISYDSKRGNWLEYRYQACEDQAFRQGEHWRNLLGGLLNG